jgi:hypothetical protein
MRVLKRLPKRQINTSTLTAILVALLYMTITNIEGLGLGICVFTNMPYRSLYRLSRVLGDGFFVSLLKQHTRYTLRIFKSLLHLQRHYGRHTYVVALRLSERDNATLDSTMTTKDDVHEVLLGLFYPWDKLHSDFQGQQLESLRASDGI